MTKREAAIVSAYTGFLLGDFSELHKYATELFERPIFTHEFADRAIQNKLFELSKKDFIAMEVKD